MNVWGFGGWEYEFQSVSISTLTEPTPGGFLRSGKEASERSQIFWPEFMLGLNPTCRACQSTRVRARPRQRACSVSSCPRAITFGLQGPRL